MKIKCFSIRFLLALFAFVWVSPSWAREKISFPSFATFDRQAVRGGHLSIVFLGGSLTLGEGASQPERTSFRTLLEDYFQEKYPRAKFSFRTVALAGMNSKRAMFRLKSDVLPQKPDLVFVDFTLEDQIDGTDRQSLAAYEWILRGLISRGIPVAQILAGNKGSFGADWKHLGPQRFRDHLEMGRLYHTAVGNSFPVTQDFFQDKTRSRSEIWPAGDLYPGDLGHRFIFESMRAGLEKAIEQKRICALATDPVFAGEYRKQFEFFPAEAPLPDGWQVKPAQENREKEIRALPKNLAVCAAADAETAQSIRFNFSGTFVGISGEATENGMGFAVKIDGVTKFYDAFDEIWPTDSEHGSKSFWYEISDQLEPGSHKIEIQPVFQDDIAQGDLRIESICVAGEGSSRALLLGNAAGH
ncbi:MAG: GDSL-type esterase/lipase family protein [Verrucomicrobiota bacterium]